MVSKVLSVEDTSLDKSTTLSGSRNKDYIDLDASLAVKPTTGDVYKKLNANSVKQAVKLLLLTNRGERPFAPFLGGNLNDFLFELAEPGTENDIEFNVRETIRVYEPRVNIDTLLVDVNIMPDYNSVSITVVFQVINTNETVELTTRLNRLR